MNEQSETIVCHEKGLTLPRLFAERMQNMLGEEFEAFIASYAKPAHPSLRANTLKVTPDEIRELAPFVGSTVPWQENGFYYPADEDVRPGKHSQIHSGIEPDHRKIA